MYVFDYDLSLAQVVENMIGIILKYQRYMHVEKQNFNKIKTALLLKCTERIHTNHQHNAVKQIQVILLKKKTTSHIS